MVGHLHSEMTRAELDDAYANGAYIAGAAAFPGRWAAQAAAFRDGCQCRIAVAYGEHRRACFDLFEPEGPAKGLLVFVHGGYWKAFDQSDWSWIARGAVAQGWAVAIIGYPLAPEVRLGAITVWVRAGIEAAAALVPRPVVLAGHSAGGHLVARMAMADGPRALWGRLRRIVAISPLADLRPFLNQSLNADLCLEPSEADAESPALHAKAWAGPVTVWVGENERLAFHDQARRLCVAWGARLNVAPGRHHFDVIDDLAKGPLLDHTLSPVS